MRLKTQLCEQIKSIVDPENCLDTNKLIDSVGRIKSFFKLSIIKMNQQTLVVICLQILFPFTYGLIFIDCNDSNSSSISMKGTTNNTYICSTF